MKEGERITEGKFEGKILKDLKAYKKLLALEKSPINSLDFREFTASDGATYSVTKGLKALNDLVAHLPVEEIEEILARRDMYMNWKGKRLGQMQRAFKLSNGKPSKKYGSRFLDEKELEVIELFGMLYTKKEVYEIVKKRMGATVTHAQIERFYETNNEAIILKQEEFKRTSDVRMGYKKTRLLELTWLYKALKNKFIRKDGNELKLSDSLLKTLEQIRKEAEGDAPTTVVNAYDVKVEQNVNMQVANILQSDQALLEIILARVAARLGISPTNMLFDLKRSPYAKMSGLVGDSVDFGEEIQWPSQSHYDFNDIEKKRKGVKKEREQMTAKAIDHVKLLDAQHQAKLTAEQAAKTKKARIKKDELLLKLKSRSKLLTKRVNDLKPKDDE